MSNALDVLSSGAIDLSSVNNLREAARRIPDGQAVLRLAERLGITADTSAISKVDFRTQVSNMSDAELSDYMAHVTARAAALAELAGVVGAMVLRAKAKSKSTRAAARARAAAAWKAENPDSKTGPKVADLAALVELDDRVADADGQLTIAEMFAGMFAGAKEGHLLVKESLSREIALRTARMQARF